MTYSWNLGEQQKGSIGCRLIRDSEVPTALELTYSSTNKFTGEKRDFNYSVSIDSTPCNYGGQRYWFICPLILNDRSCHRRCRILYLPSGASYFGCRLCYNLTYRSRQEHRSWNYENARLFNKLRKVENKYIRAKRPWIREKYRRQIVATRAGIEQMCKTLEVKLLKTCKDLEK